MKGIVFTEFVELVEDRFGIEVLDSIIENSNLESKGVYTAVGTYSHFEMVELLTNLSSTINVSIPDLLFVYSEHFFQVLVDSYPGFFQKQTNAFDFLESIESYIHPEVLKLYPDAELPKFVTKRSGNQMDMTYISERKLADFAHGLMTAAVSHFDEDISIAITRKSEDQTEVEFQLIKN